MLGAFWRGISGGAGPLNTAGMVGRTLRGMPTGAFGRGVQGATIGAGLGAGYGAIDSNTSVLGGALGGAGMGLGGVLGAAGARGAWRGFNTARAGGAGVMDALGTAASRGYRGARLASNMAYNGFKSTMKF